MTDAPCFLVTLEANETPSATRSTILAFALGADEAAARAAAAAELEHFGWAEIEILRAAEVTDPSAVPEDLRGALATAYKWGCGLIIYEAP